MEGDFSGRERYCEGKVHFTASTNDEILKILSIRIAIGQEHEKNH